MFEAVAETVCHILNVDVIPLEVLLVNDEEAVRYGSIHKIIYQQIQSHTWRRPKHSGQPQRNRVEAVEQLAFSVNFSDSIQRYRLKRCIFGAVDLT
jgi:hypothetical protein